MAKRILTEPRLDERLLETRERTLVPHSVEQFGERLLDAVEAAKTRIARA